MPLRLVTLSLALAAVAPVHAEKADRSLPLTLSSDKQGVIDNVNRRRRLEGNVIITQGSLALRAEVVDVRETPDGYIQAHANGLPGKPVSFRQGRDKPGEAVDGVADQVEYDTRTETVRFIGNARVRSTQGTAVRDEVTGALIVYNSRTEVVTLDAGSASPNPNGRLRMVVMPPAPPADDAASAPAPALPLKPSTTLQPGKPQ